MKWVFPLIVIAILLSQNGAEARRRGKALTQGDSHRKERLFPIFNVVQFNHESCTVQSDTNLRGSCLTTTECSDKGGSADGNCASGFGVCCLIKLNGCGGTVNYNCTYLMHSQAASETCTYTFNRICDNLRQIRLDFESFTLAAPTASNGLCSDTAVAVSPTGASPPSNICGVLTGQHMYLETGDSGNAGTFTVTTGTGTAPATRMYNVKVSYIEESNPSRAPTDCTQYFQDSSGTLSTYNFNNGNGPQLAGQDYTFCIRQNDGFCSFQVSETPGTNDAFALDEDLNGAGVIAQSEISCLSTNFIQIPNSRANGPFRCGGVLNDMDAQTVPGTVVSGTGEFNIRYSSANTLNLGLLSNTGAVGFSLDYAQRPCNAVDV